MQYLLKSQFSCEIWIKNKFFIINQLQNNYPCIKKNLLFSVVNIIQTRILNICRGILINKGWILEFLVIYFEISLKFVTSMFLRVAYILRKKCLDPWFSLPWWVMNNIENSEKSPKFPQIPKGFWNPRICIFWGWNPQGWSPWSDWLSSRIL